MRPAGVRAHPHVAGRGQLSETAWSDFGLARALWRQGKDRRRALELAQQARNAYVADGPYSAFDLREVEAWLKRPR